MCTHSVWQYCSPSPFLKKQTSKSVKVEASLFYFLFKDSAQSPVLLQCSQDHPFLHYRILSSKPQTADELTVCILNNYPTILELFYLPENLSFFRPSFEHTEITKNLQLDTHSSGKMLQLSQNSRKDGSGSTSASFSAYVPVKWIHLPMNIILLAHKVKCSQLM